MTYRRNVNGYEGWGAKLEKEAVLGDGCAPRCGVEVVAVLGLILGLDPV